MDHANTGKGGGDGARPRLVYPRVLLRRFWWAGVLAVAGLVMGGLWLREAFHDRGYAPAQPIAFSHRQHAGDLGLDCRYCHFNAAKGEVAGVPPMDVCLGCHRLAAGDRPEVQRLLAIAEQGRYEAEDGTLREGGVVHWNRVHRLPDHVRFDHRAHVAANVACQTCHGPVEEMTVLRQHADLTMGWCLDCHRRDNYVGGPGWDGRDAGFRVGSANPEVTVRRMDRDPVVAWVQEHRQLSSSAAPPQGLNARLDRLIAAHPEWKDLPRWRVADLPATHREFYGRVGLQNAPVQCSTCHR